MLTLPRRGSACTRVESVERRCACRRTCVHDQTTVGRPGPKIRRFGARALRGCVRLLVHDAHVL